MTNTISKKISLVGSTTTDEIDLGSYELVGVNIPNVTSTSFTLSAATEVGGTHRAVKDALGTYETAGNTISFTIAADANGYFYIPEAVSRGLRFVKFIFSSSESFDFIINLKSNDS